MSDLAKYTKKCFFVSRSKTTGIFKIQGYSDIHCGKFHRFKFCTGNFAAWIFRRAQFQCMLFSPRPISSLEFSPHDIFSATFFAAINFAARYLSPFENTFHAFWSNEAPIVLRLSDKKHLGAILVLITESRFVRNWAEIHRWFLRGRRKVLKIHDCSHIG